MCLFFVGRRGRGYLNVANGIFPLTGNWGAFAKQSHLPQKSLPSAELLPYCVARTTYFDAVGSVARAHLQLPA